MTKEQLTETILKSGFNLVPYVGGALASIVGDYTSSRKEERLNEFLQSFCSDMSEKQNLIVEEYIASDDFLDIFENILSDILKNRTETKRILLKNLLVNSCIIPETTYDRTEEFQYMINTLSSISLLILSVFYKLKDVAMDGTKNTIDKYWNEINTATGIYNNSVLLDYIGELESRSLIDSFRTNTYGIDNGFSTIANKPFLTEKGNLFCLYIVNHPGRVLINSTQETSIPKTHITLTDLENRINSIPKVYTGTSDTPPASMKNGDFYFQYK